MNNDKEKPIEEMNGERYLWEFSKNLLIKPNRVKVQKETAKCYWLDTTVGRKVSKVENPNNPDWVGDSTYSMFYRTEDSAKQAYERLKDESARRLADKAIRRFVSKVEQIDEMAFLITNCIIGNKTAQETADDLYNAGYGNVKEFANKVIKEIDSWGSTADTSMLIDYVENLVNEFCKDYRKVEESEE